VYHRANLNERRVYRHLTNQDVHLVTQQQQEFYLIFYDVHRSSPLDFQNSSANSTSTIQRSTFLINARQMFENAIELDPKYADAYAALGFAYFLDLARQGSFGPSPSGAAFQLEQQALALDCTRSRSLTWKCVPLVAALLAGGTALYIRLRWHH
jgi:hypothetical protein